MLGRVVAATLCAVTITLYGCGSKKVEEPVAIKPPTPEFQAGTWVGKSNAAEVTFSLAKDGRFQTVFRGGNYRSVVKGVAQIKDSSILLEPKELDGKPPKNPAELRTSKMTFDPEWKVLTTEQGLRLERKI